MPVATFRHTRIEILNPGQAYETTQSLADRIRSFTPPDPRAEGIRAPSVRTPGAGGYQDSVRPLRYERAEAERSGFLEGGVVLGVFRPGRKRGHTQRSRGGLDPSQLPGPSHFGAHPSVWPALQVSCVGATVRRTDRCQHIRRLEELAAHVTLPREPQST